MAHKGKLKFPWNQLVCMSSLVFLVSFAIFYSKALHHYHASTFMIYLSKKKMGSTPLWIVPRLVTMWSINIPVQMAKVSPLLFSLQYKFFCWNFEIKSNGQFRNISMWWRIPIDLIIIILLLLLLLLIVIKSMRIPKQFEHLNYISPDETEAHVCIINPHHSSSDNWLWHIF